MTGKDRECQLIQPVARYITRIGRIEGPNVITCRAFNFGIPALPWINGRDLAGTVIKIPDDPEYLHSNPRLRVGDIVLVPSTDYRDVRKAAFQEYAITTEFNAVRIPPSVPIHASASLGVAFVASVLALGVSFGLDFSLVESLPGPNFVNILQAIGESDPTIPVDVRGECFHGKEEKERVKRGDWIAIWGGMFSCSHEARHNVRLIIPLLCYSIDHNRLHNPTTSQTGRSQSHLRCRPRQTRRENLQCRRGSPRGQT